ncbi:MAG TPA: hypothetical protein VEH29_12585, partial [Acidimicrobiales bacterium]|nr:hypothetical protein [Acidimicrobiales bacterium]
VSLAGCDTVICVAPMSFDPSRPPDPRDRVIREVATRALLRATGRLRRQGIRVVTLTPGPKEVAVQGVNLMRSTALEQVAEVAYAETVAHLRQLKDRGHLGGVAA